MEAVGAGEQLEIERTRVGQVRSTVATVTPTGCEISVSAGCHGQSGSMNP